MLGTVDVLISVELDVVVLGTVLVLVWVDDSVELSVSLDEFSVELELLELSD